MSLSKSERLRWIIATASVITMASVVAIADEKGNPPPEPGGATPACYTSAGCNNTASRTACYACCDNHCPSADKVDCQDACDDKFGSSSQ